MKSACAFIVLSIAAFVCAKPNGEAIESAKLPQISDLIAQARAGIENITKDYQTKLGSDQDQIIKTIKAQGTELATNVENYINKVSEDIKTKSPELEKTWNDVKAKLTDVVNDINTQIPNAKEQAGQLQEKLTNGLKVILEESNKAAKTINENSGQVQEDIAKFTKQAVEIAAQATKNLDSKLRELAATPAPAKAQK